VIYCLNEWYQQFIFLLTVGILITLVSCYSSGCKHFNIHSDLISLLLFLFVS